MIAPARVPQLMMAESFHHSVPSPRSLINRFETTKVSASDASEVIQTNQVSGASKLTLAAFEITPFCTASLIQYESTLTTTMVMRMAKIQTSSWTWVAGSLIATKMKLISATPVTPYVSKPSALGPTESPALSPTQSAITPGLRASSSLTLKTIFIRSEPMSAILVKMPPAMRSAEAPSDSPIAKPMKHGPAYSPGMNSKMPSISTSSTLISSMPMLMPALSGIAYTG